MILRKLGYRLLSLLISIQLSIGDLPPFTCSREDYGSPEYNACKHLLFYGTPDVPGIFNIDLMEHAFYLPYFASASQFTENQWRHRIALPIIWATKRDFCLTSQHLGVGGQRANICVIDSCKIALLVSTTPSGAFTVDSGWWSNIAMRGQAVLDHCLIEEKWKYPYGGAGGQGWAGERFICLS